MPSPDEFVFSPARDKEVRHAEWRRNRKSKVPPSQQNRRKATPARAPGERYTPMAYAHAVAKACEKAGVPPWSPNRLRHSRATEVRGRYGLEAAQVILGHASADVTQVYAERDLQKAVEIMREVG